MSVLKIDSSARTEGSNSRVLTQYLVDQLGKPVTTRDLGEMSFPPLAGQDLIDLHGARRLDRESLIEHHSIAEDFIQELKAAEVLVIGAPIYNFTVPAVLRNWIDYIAQPGVTFKYSPEGPIGLTKNINEAYIVTSSGGTAIGSNADFCSPYMEFICRFIGIENVHHIHASGSKRTPDQVIEAGKQQIDELIA